MKKILVDSISSEFFSLIESNPSEEKLHRYLVRYPALLPVWQPLDNVVYSKFPLGNEHVTDFAFVRDDTPGLRWEFIEIEKPQDPLFTKKGDPSSRLTHALRQLHDWHVWFQENRAYVARNFPHGHRAIKTGLADPHLILVMGRRSPDWWDQREKLRRIGGGVVIRTFDGLEHNLHAPPFDARQPLRLLGFSSTGHHKLLASMKIEISYYVGEATDEPPDDLTTRSAPAVPL